MSYIHIFQVQCIHVDGPQYMPKARPVEGEAFFYKCFVRENKSDEKDRSSARYHSSTKSI